MILPHDIQLAFRNALRFHQSGQISKAESIYREILKRNPKHFDTLHLLGSSLIQQGHNREGVEFISQALLIQPNNPDAHFNLGHGWHYLGDFAKAVSCYDRAIDLRPTDAEYHLAKGKALEAMAQLEGALICYDQAISLRNDYDEAHIRRISVLIGLNRIEEANDSCNREISLETKSYELIVTLGKSLRRLVRLEEALAKYDRAIAIKPEHPEAYYESGRAFHEQKQYQAAVISYDKAISLKPNYPTAHFHRALALKELERFDEAIAGYDRAIDLKPDYFGAHFNRGNILKELKCFDAALASYEKAISLKPEYAEAHNNRGSALASAERLDEALISYEKAISLKPDYAEAYSNRGNALVDLRRFDEAFESYGKAISLKPGYADAYNNLGNALKELNRLEDAIASYDKAIELRPDYAGARFNKSLLLLQNHSFLEGFELHLSRWDIDGVEEKAPQTSIPRWDGSLKNGEILLWAEQGVGDEVFFASLLSLIDRNSIRVTLSADKRLHPIYKRSFPETKLVDRELTKRFLSGEFAAQAPIGDIGHLLKVQEEEIAQRRYPYLFADPGKRKQLETKNPHLQKKPVCGISWKSGNKKNGRHRSISLLDLVPLLASPDMTFVNLQYGNVAPEIVEIGERLGIEINTIEDLDVFNDIDGLLALIDLCDMVFTIDNLTAHLAGAAGKKAVVLVPTGSGRYWYWGGESRSLWYPSLHLVYQECAGEWTNAIEEASHVAKQLIGAESSQSGSYPAACQPHRLS